MGNKGLWLSVLSLISIITLLGGLFSGATVYLGLLPSDSHIGVGITAIAVSVLCHVLNASASQMNFVSVLFLVGAFWSGLMNIEGKGGDTKTHVIVATIAVTLSVLTDVLNLRLYIKEKRGR